MISVARKNLLAEKTRLLASVSGVTFSIVLIIVLLGVYNAFSTLATAYIDNMEADVIIAQEGVTEMFHSYSVLDNTKVSQVERLSGGKAYGLINRATNVRTTENDGSKIVDYPGRLLESVAGADTEALNIVGYDTKANVGGPWITLAGKSIPDKHEIIVDRVFAAKTGLYLNDQLEAFGRVFTISGITDQNNILVYTRAFIDKEEAQEILNQESSVNFILLQLPDPNSAREVSQKLEDELEGISAYTKHDFAISNAKMITDSFLPIIAVIVVIGFLTGTVVVGLTIYTATMEKLSEFGILKAIGANSGRLFLIVVEQAIWTALLGFILGALVSQVVVKVSTDLVPVMIVDINADIYLAALLTSVVIGILASYLPIRKIANLDPATVFRK